MVCVGICYTKNTDLGLLYNESFKKSVIDEGDTFKEVRSVRDLHVLNSCDISFQVCDQHFTNRRHHDVLPTFKENVKGVKNLRAGIKKVSKQPRIIVDAGFIKHNKQIDKMDAYISLCLNEIKRNGIQYAKESNSTRWEKLNLTMPKWRKSGGHILLIGQNEEGIGTTNIRKSGISFYDWSRYALETIRKYTDRKIIYKPHPHQEYLPDPVSNCEIVDSTSTHKISDFFEDCWCAVGSASNATVDCVMAGIPVITEDKMSVAYDVAEHSVLNIENPRMPDITQWLYNICYAQWNIDELGNGEAWKYIKKNILNLM